MTTVPFAPPSRTVDGRSAEIEPTPSDRSTATGDGSFRSFLTDQIRALGPFDFVLLTVPDSPGAGFEVVREEDEGLRVRLVAQPPAALSELQRASFAHLGFQAVPQPDTETAWERHVAPAGAEDAAAVVEDALAKVFGVDTGAPLDVHHGNRRAAYEAQKKLEALRVRIEPILTDLLGSVPSRDGDGDWVFPYESTQVVVAPRAMPEGKVVVRVFAITNAGLPITPQLALFIANLNFNLTFCRFALDLRHGAVWVDETLLGEQVSDEELRFTIKVVASTAAEWDTRIQQMFGGFTAKDAMSGRSVGTVPQAKPGHGGYL